MEETGTEQVGRRERGIVRIYCAQCSLREMREARFREAGVLRLCSYMPMQQCNHRAAQVTQLSYPVTFCFLGLRTFHQIPSIFLLVPSYTRHKYCRLLGVSYRE